MCGRFSLAATPDELGAVFDVDPPTELLPRYNLAPTQAIVGIVPGVPRRQLRLFRWGLTPSWSREGKPNAGMINARAETAAEKPSFRVALRQRRCLIPADGFYEWTAGRTPHRIEVEGGLFAMAGLWETWRDGADPSAEPLHTCAVLTTAANPMMQALHERMPVILAPEAWDRWLDPATPLPAVQALLVPYAGAMRERIVSRAVNNVRNEGPQCQAAPEQELDS